jgi:hypothetical protein
MAGMFQGATGFDQDLSSRVITGVTAVGNFTNMLSGTQLSLYNYNALLDSWSKQSPVAANVLAFSLPNVKYGGCVANAQAGIDGHMKLVQPVADGGFAWTVTDGGLAVCGTEVNYPECNQEDIQIGDYKLSACKVGANVAGTGSASYGEYFQWGNTYGFANSGEVSPNSTDLVSGAVRPYSNNTWIYGMSSPFDRTTPQNGNLR